MKSEEYGRMSGFALNDSVETPKEKTMIYFTSDLHLGHQGIIKLQNRPFESLEEMNKTLIANYNAMIHRDDTVYILLFLKIYGIL